MTDFFWFDVEDAVSKNTLHKNVFVGK